MLANSKVTFLPIRLGVMGYIYEDLIYVYADAGSSHYYSPTSGTHQNGFTFGLGGGYKLYLDTKQFIQVSTYFNLHNFKNEQVGQNYNYSWMNIRAAYGLSWGRKARKE